jgi:hypothetical protein
MPCHSAREACRPGRRHCDAQTRARAGSDQLGSGAVGKRAIPGAAALNTVRLGRIRRADMDVPPVPVSRRRACRKTLHHFVPERQGLRPAFQKAVVMSHQKHLLTLCGLLAQESGLISGTDRADLVRQKFVSISSRIERDDRPKGILEPEEAVSFLG